MLRVQNMHLDLLTLSSAFHDTAFLSNCFTARHAARMNALGLFRLAIASRA